MWKNPIPNKMLGGPRRKLPAENFHESKEEICFGVGQSSLGPVLVASGAKGVVSIFIGEDSNRLIDDLEQLFPTARLVHEDRDCEDLLAQVVGAIETPGHGLDFRLDLRGTDFQKRVWRAVQKIPMGQTSTYSEIARKIGAPKAIRAVGSACAKSNHAVAIPCHRVLPKDGSPPGGSYWANGRHQTLLDREAAAKPKARSRSALPPKKKPATRPKTPPATRKS